MNNNENKQNPTKRTFNSEPNKLICMSNFLMKKVISVFLVSVCFFPFVSGSSANISENKTENQLESVSAEEVKDKQREQFETIKVDCIFSIGAECRPAFYLSEYHFRFQSSPLDWMMKYSLDTTIHFFETKFEDFFDKIEEIPNKFCHDCKHVKDIKNNVVSIHHFKKDVPLSEERTRIRELMLHRAKQVDDIFKKSESIGLICNRPTESDEEFIDFIKKFSNIYKGKKITLINIVDDETAKDVKQSTIFNQDNLKIIKFTFSDKTPEGNPENKPGWIANYTAWDMVMKTIELSDKVFGNSKFPEEFVD